VQQVGGKEEDSEWGSQMILDYGFRLYNPAIGRFLSMDPLAKAYPWFTPYQFAANMPIVAIDLDGLEAVIPEGGGIVLVNPETGEITGDLGLGDIFISATPIPGKVTWSDVWSVTKEVGIIALGFTPVGVVLDVIDLGVAIHSGDATQIGFALAGFIPGAGDAIKGAKRIFETTKKARKYKKYLNSIKCACFESETIVLTEEGYKQIDDVILGDRVWAYDEVTGDTILKEVTYLHETTRDTIFRIYVEGELIEATSEHPFLLQGGWIEAKDLLIGDEIQTFEGDYAIVDSIFLVKGRHTVHNFTVKDNHNYFVGYVQVLGHNCGGKAKSSKKVYRALSKKDAEDLANGKDLVARSPDAGNTPISHVAGKKKSQWISTTKDKETATGKYNGGNGVVEIDLNKVDSESVDLSKGIQNGGRFSNYAKKDQEVLIKNTIPNSAVKIIEEL
jgi:RHS repeat-associated protein